MTFRGWFSDPDIWTVFFILDAFSLKSLGTETSMIFASLDRPSFHISNIDYWLVVGDLKFFKVDSNRHGYD